MIIDDYIKNATPEQLIFLDQIRTKVGFNQIVPFHFEGNIAATELAVYAANKLYFALQCDIASVGVQVSQCYVQFNNESDALSIYANSNSIYWDVTNTVPKFYGNNLYLRNFYFSRIIPTAYYSIVLTGFKSLT